MKRSLLVSVLALASPVSALSQTSGASAASQSAQGPIAVSPGAFDSFLAAAPCPTFSWTAGSPASGYELRVYRLEEGDRLGAVPAMQASLPAGALSWSPPADRCLETGRHYAWSVRGVGDDPGAWSEALIFEVSASEIDLATALAALERHLGIRA